ncbi:MAG: DUF1028 domain-containing protein [Bacillota bacterium]
MTDKTIATFSIVALDPETGELGVAVQSRFLAVGSIVPWAEAGVGAIATQARGNPTYGPKGLSLLREGKSPRKVIEILLKNDEEKEYRQLGVIDTSGNSANFTGSECQGFAGSIKGTNFTAQGNILVNENTLHEMASKFKNEGGRLADRLVSSLKAGQRAGGDSRGKQAAALYIVKKNGSYGGYSDRYIDLRVDDHNTPIKELERLLNLFYETFEA